ncbi:MAG: hypothetical protein QNJ64_03930 [Crocosphaera sp.]|nr:hypothetical protein [Crocosphaera sp.]
MNTEEKARELMAQKHLDNEQRDQAMIDRSLEVEQTHHSEEVEEKARELLTEKRKQKEAIDETMLERSVEEIN